MNETEELITAALAKHVERTPHSGPILNALTRRRRRVRPTLIAIIAATAVAAGIAIPMAIPKPEASTPPATQQPMPVEPKGIKIRYGLTPPPGYTEQARSSTSDQGEQTRTWMKERCTAEQTGPQCSMSMTLAVSKPSSSRWAEATASSGEPVNVGGTEGRLSVSSDGKLAFLRWRLADEDVACTLSLYDIDQDVRRTVVAIAETVKMDQSATVQPVLSFGKLPPDLTRTTVKTGTDSWVMARTPTKTESSGAAVEAKVVPLGSTQADDRTVAVPASDGREIRVMRLGSHPLSTEQLLEIARGVTVEPAPDLSWVGK